MSSLFVSVGWDCHHLLPLYRIIIELLCGIINNQKAPKGEEWEGRREEERKRGREEGRDEEIQSNAFENIVIIINS